jgi:magnesium transporter
MAMPSVRTIQGSGFNCLEVREPTLESIEELKGHLPFLVDEDLRDLLPPFERPKLIEREHYLFLVLLYPVYDERHHVIRPTEVDFLLGRDFLVVCHDGTLGEIGHLLARRSPHGSPIKLLLEAAHELTVTRFPLLKSISNELLSIERRLFGSTSGQIIRDIMRTRTNILGFREAMQGHTMALGKLATHGERFFDVEARRGDIRDVVTHIEDVWTYLSNDRDTAETLYESHLSLITLKTNEAMKSLTALAFVVFPTSLAAAIFAMSAQHMPIQGHPYDFWIMLAVVASVMISIIAFVKWKRWL